MIRKLVLALILVPLAVLIVVLAVGNRQPVTVSLDPFMSGRSAFAVTLPMFVVILAALIAGVVVGGAAAWLRQRKWRRAARRAMREARVLRTETEALKERLAAAERTSPPPPATVRSIAYRRPPAA